MAFQVSPGVQVQEVDLTNVVPAVSTSIGAIAGAFTKGPIGEIVTVGSEKDLVNIFGKPNDSTYKYFMPAAQFLKYGNALKVVRTESTGILNAAASQTGILVKNSDHYDTVTFNADDTFVARDAGVLGNSIQVSVCSANSDAWNNWLFAEHFVSIPGTSDYISNVGGSNDELHIIVIDKNGAISGAAGTILEKFAYVSQASDAKSEDGTSNYYKNVINSTSSYVYWAAHETELSDAGSASTEFSSSGSASIPPFVTYNPASYVSLSGGVDGTVSDGNLHSAYDMFADAETVDVNLLIAAAGSNAGTHGAYVRAIVDARKDCVAFVSPAIADTVNNSTATADVITWSTAVGSSSYVVKDSTALYVYDKYNDAYRWIHAAGDIAGLCANTDDVADAWFSPAGYTRGNLRGVTKIAFNPVQADRDTLYKGSVNPVVSFPGTGIKLYCDKTGLAKPSAFDRINVRRLFITLEKSISTAAKAQLFEFNDEFTRAQFRNMVEPFLRTVQGRRGVTDFRVVCDETNNTGQIIDSNQFVADIYIKPARSINFITLSFIATRSGVEFSEIVGS